MAVSKELACKGLVGAIYKDATDVAQLISEDLTGKGIVSTLMHFSCRNAFCAEWFFARLVWLQSEARTIQDVELRATLLDEIDTGLDEIAALIPDLSELRSSYYMMAIMHSEDQRDSFGLPYGPGPFLSERYERHVREILDEAVPTEESNAIALLGDHVCWRLQTRLEEALGSILKA